MALGWILDPGSAQFDLNDLTSTFVQGQSLPMPAPQAQYVSAIDVDGDTLYSSRYGNRTVTLTVEVKGTSASNLETVLGHLHQKVASINREAVLSDTGVGGLLQYTSPSGAIVGYDVCSVSATPDLGATYFFGHLATVTLTLDCLPYWRATEVTLSSHSETTLPCLIFTETGIAGDAEGLGRLVVTEAQGADQSWLTWGVQSRNYSSSADAALFYEAESRTRLASSTTAGTSGASAGVCVRSAALTTSYIAVLSTQATGGGNHLSHVGEFRVYARAQTPAANTGAVSVAFEWAQGDYLRPTRNSTVTFPVDTWDATWQLVDLGVVSLSEVVQGTQRWEGRVLASSTVAGDKVDVDYLMLVPVSEGSGVVSAAAPTATPSVLVAHDEFGQTAGVLSGKTLPVGGTWTTAGDVNDLAVETTGHTVTRSTNANETIGRYAVIAATSALSASQVDVVLNGGIELPRMRGGPVLRYTNTSNVLKSYVDNLTGQVFVSKVVAGTTTQLGTVKLASYRATAWSTLRLIADAGGRWWLYAAARGSTLNLMLTGQDDVLATGGTLATGATGFFDWCPSTTVVAGVRNYDNFLSYTPVTDAALFASQTAELRHDRYSRQDSTGTVWVDETIEGDYLRIPPAALEGRTVRMIVKATRNTPTDGPDSTIDDISAVLHYTPRGLLLPE